MNTSLIVTGLGSATITSSTTVKDDGTIDRDSRNSALGTTVATTATAVAGATLNANGTREVYQKYAQAYVESMSDEELEAALTRMDLLIEEQSSNDDVKTL